jgi:hypothetical protein
MTIGVRTRVLRPNPDLDPAGQRLVEAGQQAMTELPAKPERRP